MERKRIRRILVDQDRTVAGLAREIHKSRQWTSRVLYGHVNSEPTRKAIAKALGMRIKDLWPENGKKAA